jgi:AcrR family transcriptional regulator
MKNKPTKSSAPSKPTPARGRPPRLSREGIIDAALALLKHDDSTPLSLNGLARAMAVSPMTLYTYFASKDEFMRAVTDRLLADLEFVMPKKATPFKKIEVWAKTMRAYFLSHPKLIDMLDWSGGNVSLGWTRRTIVLAEFLEELGFEGEDMARAAIWIGHIVMGSIEAEIRHRLDPRKLSMDKFETLEPELKRRIALLIRVHGKPDYSVTFFDYQVERTLSELKVMVRNLKK